MNVFTVDVEEWFHVCGVDDRLPRDGWGALPGPNGGYLAAVP